MKVEVYCFEFFSKKEYENLKLNKREFVEEMLKRNCKPFLIFNNIYNHAFRLDVFANKNLKVCEDLARNEYLKGYSNGLRFESIYFFIFFREIDKNKNIDKVYYL